MDEEHKDLSPTGSGSGDSTPVPSLSGFSSPTNIIAGSSQASRAVNVHNDLCQGTYPFVGGFRLSTFVTKLDPT